jgi:hypothetical protein
MNLEVYEPDVQKYVRYYVNQVEGKNKCKRYNQSGGNALGARRNNRQYYIISPSEQIVKQAEARLENDIKPPVKRKRSRKLGKRKKVNKSRKTQI